MHARGGDRAKYSPVESVLVPHATGDPHALIQAYRDTLGARECYLADLDAIQGGSMQHELVRSLSRAGPGLLVDAGIRDPIAAARLLAAGAGCVVVGLETLESFAQLADIVATTGRDRVLFSLDLREGQPVSFPAGPQGSRLAEDAVALAVRAAESGVETLMVLDLARIGSGAGVDLALLRTLRERLPGRRIIAGGGVGTFEDLLGLREAGCDGALVATALHTGRIGPRELEATRQSSASVSR